MKCLSIKQPYADLIMLAQKTVELRTWNTNYRGELLIHASSIVDTEGMKRFNMGKSLVRTGEIIGKVLLYGVTKYPNVLAVREDQKKHLAGEEYIRTARYGFLLRQPKALITPIPYRGLPGIFEVNLGSVSYA